MEFWNDETEEYEFPSKQEKVQTACAEVFSFLEVIVVPGDSKEEGVDILKLKVGAELVENFGRNSTVPLDFVPGHRVLWNLRYKMLKKKDAPVGIEGGTCPRR